MQISYESTAEIDIRLRKVIAAADFNLNPYLHDGTEHKLLIPQRFKKYPLNLRVKL